MNISTFFDNLIPDVDEFSRPSHWADIYYNAYLTDDRVTLAFGWEVLTQMPAIDQVQALICLALEIIF